MFPATELVTVFVVYERRSLCSATNSYISINVPVNVLLRLRTASFGWGLVCVAGRAGPVRLVAISTVVHGSVM